jgi:Phage portal protein, SPP1 Gp6-like.
VKLRVPGLSEDELVTLNLLADRLRKKETRNRLRSSYYDGKRVVRQVGITIPPNYMKLALTLGWCAKGVDGLARRVNIDKFVWANGDLDSLGLQSIIDDNFLFSELAQARVDALIHGVSYLVTTRGMPGEPDVLVHSKDARNAIGDWNVRTRRLDSLLSVTSRDGAQITGFVLYLPNVTITAQRVDGAWQVDRSEHIWGVPAEPLVYRPRTSRRMGRSRITRAAMKHQDAAVRALTRIEAHMDIYAVQKFILLGADDESFMNADGSPKDSWQVLMGRVLALPDNDEATEQANQRADVKQFSAESPAPHLAQLNALAKLEAREFDLPDSDFAMTDLANPTSADSYNASRENLISEAEGFMQDLDAPIRRTVVRALAMLNGETHPEWAQIQPKWRSPVYLSKAAAADAGAKQLAAIPWLADTEVGLELAGLDEQQIARAMAEKRRAAGRQVLAAIGADSADAS